MAKKIKSFTLSEIKEMLRKVIVYENDVLEADDPCAPSWVNWGILNKILDRWEWGELKKRRSYWG